MITQKEFEADQNSSKKEGFRQWMQEPMTRAMISTIPACEQLEVLLQAAFETGFNRGSGKTAMSFLEAIITRPGR